MNAGPRPAGVRHADPGWDTGTADEVFQEIFPDVSPQTPPEAVPEAVPEAAPKTSPKTSPEADNAGGWWAEAARRESAPPWDGPAQDAAPFPAAFPAPGASPARDPGAAAVSGARGARGPRDTVAMRPRADTASMRVLRARYGRKGTMIAAVVVAGCIGLAAVVGTLVLGRNGTSGAAGAGANASAPAAGAGATPSPAESPAGRRMSAPATPGQAPAGQGEAIPVASAVAFGPAGTSDGDNPANAALALGGSSKAGWNSSWYATPEFGGLKAGTGLLIDMGKKVTIDSVQLTLGTTPGASLQIRTGDVPVPGDLTMVASASDAPDAVSLPLGAPVSARYVEIWFTKLPLYSPGKYRISVSHITVTGQP